MIALKNILVATDFSDCSVAAVRQGFTIAAAFDASLHLLHVATAPFSEPWAGYKPGAGLIAASVRRSTKLKGANSSRRWPGPPGFGQNKSSWPPLGRSHDEILKYAREHAVDLVVCGTHGRRGLNHLIMGSVAERVLRLAPCPVLTVHGSPAVARQALTRPAEAVAVR